MRPQEERQDVRCMKYALLVASSRRRPGPEGPGFDESWLHTRRRRAHPTSMSADTQCYSAVRNLNSADDVGCDTQWEFNLRNLNSADDVGCDTQWEFNLRNLNSADDVGCDTQWEFNLRNLNSADDVGCDTQWEFNLRNLNSADIRRQTHRHPCTSRVVGFADRVGFGNARAPHLPMSVPRRARRRPQSSSRLSGALRQATAAEQRSAALLSAALRCSRSRTSPATCSRRCCPRSPMVSNASLASLACARLRSRRSPTLAVAPWNFVEIDQAVFAPQHRQ